MENRTESRLSCPQCQTAVAPGLLACPGCHSLVYARELRQMAADAESQVREGKISEGLQCWRKALEWLPPDSRQANVVAGKIEDLSRKMDQSSGGRALSRDREMPKILAGIGVLGFLLWKFKFLIVILLTKGKLLLLGLTKAQTFFSMFVAFGVYWTAWGWKFALGLVLSIYVHEMGHVLALQKLGIRASAPVFIPGLGALIRLKQSPASPVEDARVGLAGPWAGLFAALVCYGFYLGRGYQSLAAIAQVGAWINLFNLLPMMPLDGGRGFRALTRGHKWIAVVVIGLMWILTREGLLALLLVGAVINALAKAEQTQPETKTILSYCVLIVILALMCEIPVPLSAGPGN